MVSFPVFSHLKDNELIVALRPDPIIIRGPAPMGFDSTRRLESRENRLMTNLACFQTWDNEGLSGNSGWLDSLSVIPNSSGDEGLCDSVTKEITESTQPPYHRPTYPEDPCAEKRHVSQKQVWACRSICQPWRALQILGPR
jgi:hypothetical protein